MIRTPKQRKAMYAKMKTPSRRMSYPIKGRGGRAQRHRWTLAALGTAAAGGALAYSLSRGKPGVAKLLFGVPGYVTSKHGRAFVSERLPEGAERLWAGVPGRIFGTKRKVYGVSPLARAEVAVKRRARNWLARKVENASLWKLGGGHEDMLHAIQQGSDLVKARVGRGLSRLSRRLTTPRVFAIKERRVFTSLPGGPAIAGTEKYFTRQLKREPSPVERFVNPPFRKLQRGLRRADVALTRGLQRRVRRVAKRA